MVDFSWRELYGILPEKQAIYWFLQNECSTCGGLSWSKNVLAHQIDNQSYEKSLLGQTNCDKIDRVLDAPRWVQSVQMYLDGGEMVRLSNVQIGVLAPLTRPGWVEAGKHLLAGLELAAEEVNQAGGIGGRPLELVVRDTAADPQRAAAAVDELASLGVVAIAGEYHSVVARAAATRAD